MHMKLNSTDCLFFKYLRIGSIAFIGIFFACESKHEPDSGTADGGNRKFYRINLFAEDKNELRDASRQLTFQEAMQASTHIFHTAAIQKVDSSATRGIPLFYIYKINEAQLDKGKNKKMLKYPIYFLAKEAFFTGKECKDSVYLFLVPLQDYHILQMNMDIRFGWLEHAPFSTGKLD